MAAIFGLWSEAREGKRNTQTVPHPFKTYTQTHSRSGYEGLELGKESGFIFRNDKGVGALGNSSSCDLAGLEGQPGAIR